MSRGGRKRSAISSTSSRRRIARLGKMNEKSGLDEHPTTKSERRLSATRYLKLDRLPTLQEVLDRRTRPPVDLFCFYVGAPPLPLTHLRDPHPRPEGGPC